MRFGLDNAPRAHTSRMLSLALVSIVALAALCARTVPTAHASGNITCSASSCPGVPYNQVTSSSTCANLLWNGQGYTQYAFNDQKGQWQHGSLPSWPSSEYSWTSPQGITLYSCDNWGTQSINYNATGAPYYETWYGQAFQCVELTARWAALLGDPSWTQLKESASSYWNTRFANWVQEPNGSSYDPGAGDIMVWSDHVAVITSASFPSGSSGNVLIIQQNSFALNGSTAPGNTLTGTQYPAQVFSTSHGTQDGGWYHINAGSSYLGVLHYV